MLWGTRFTREYTPVRIYSLSPQLNPCRPARQGPTADGYYMIFMIGTPNSPDTIADCTHGIDPEILAARGGMGGKAGTIDMGYSKSLHGPWSAPRTIRAIPPSSSRYYP